MNTQASSQKAMFPVLSRFFIMGFVDVTGIATNYVKQDFSLTDSQANLLPMMAFIWFAVFSIPTGLLMGRIGRRNTVVLSFILTIIAMCIPLAYYHFTAIFMAFSLLGIGNTMLQVSLNPMAAAIVPSGRIASILTLGQFLKAVSSFLGPLLAGMAAIFWNDWKWIFAIYALTTLLTMGWLSATVRETPKPGKTHATFRTTCALFKDRYIRMLFLGILLIVGIDVGLNTTIPKLLIEKTGIPLEKAGLGTSLYFSARTVGTFAGAFILSRTATDRFLRYSMILAAGALVSVMLMGNTPWSISVMIVMIGLTCANVFSILLSYALQHLPERDNEISALMIMGVSGGALVTPLMGILSDMAGQTASLFLLLLCIIYLGAIPLKTCRKISSYNK